MHETMTSIFLLAIEEMVSICVGYTRFPHIEDSSRRSVGCLPVLYRRWRKAARSSDSHRIFAARFELSTSTLLTNPLLSVVKLCGFRCKDDSIPPCVCSSCYEYRREGAFVRAAIVAFHVECVSAAAAFASGCR
jgi:hypothetical protein